MLVRNLNFTLMVFEEDNEKYPNFRKYTKNNVHKRES